MKGRWHQQPLFVVLKEMSVGLNFICPSINHWKGWKSILYFFLSLSHPNKWHGIEKKRQANPYLYHPKKNRRKEKKRSTEVILRWIVETKEEIILWVPWPCWCTWTNIQGHALWKKKKPVKNDSVACTKGNARKREKWNICPSKWVISYEWVL